MLQKINLYSKNQGNALITALFMMALIASMVTAMSMMIMRQITRVQLTLHTNQRENAQVMVVLWAMNVLRQPQAPFIARDQQGLIRRFPEQKISIDEPITLSGQLIDLQAFFNINNIKDPLFRLYFYQLLRQQLQPITMPQLTIISQSSADWILPRQNGNTNTDHVAFYLKQKPPYLSSHFPMSSVSEWRLVEGVNALIDEKLNPFLSALPETLPVNLNTAPKALLMALGNGLKAKQVDELLRARTEKLSLHELNALLARFNIPGQQVTTESRYFLVIATARTHQFTQTRYTILQRLPTKTGQYQINVLQNTWDAM